jgi:CheY-like chemotaxis protein
MRKCATVKARSARALAVALQFRICVERASYSPDSLSGAYAVVVDADKERRTLVAGILRYCGALVTPVETPDDAYAVLLILKPDVVVVDFARPHEAAIAFVARVRARRPEDGAKVPTIAIVDSEADAGLARARRFDVALTRPLDAWALCQAVAEFLP